MYLRASTLSVEKIKNIYEYYQSCWLANQISKNMCLSTWMLQNKDVIFVYMVLRTDPFTVFSFFTYRLNNLFVELLVILYDLHSSFFYLLFTVMWPVSPLVLSYIPTHLILIKHVIKNESHAWQIPPHNCFIITIQKIEITQALV